MRASSDWRSARYLQAQRRSGARRALRDADEAIEDAIEATWEYADEISRGNAPDRIEVAERDVGDACARIDAAHRAAVRGQS